MRARIQKTMVLILGLALLLSYGFFSFIVYYQNLSLLKSEVKQEARYIRTAWTLSVRIIWNVWIM